MQWSAVLSNHILIKKVEDIKDTTVMVKPHFWNPVVGHSSLNAQNYSLEDDFPDQWTLLFPVFVLPGSFSTSGSGLQLGKFFILLHVQSSSCNQRPWSLRCVIYLFISAQVHEIPLESLGLHMYLFISLLY